jgi:transposase
MQELDKQRFRHKQVLVQRRLQCVYLKASISLSNELIGSCMGVHANQVGQYIRLYERGGIAKLSETHYGTNRSALEDYAELLVNAFVEKPPLSLPEARHRILELTGLQRDNSRLEAFLKRHGRVGDPICLPQVRLRARESRPRATASMVGRIF